MPSKLVVDRQKSAAQVAAAGETHARTIGEALALTFLPLIQQAETPPDVRMVVVLLMRVLLSKLSFMVTADEAHESELRDDATPRAARDTMARKVYNHLLQVRDAVTGIYGEAVARQLGLSGETPIEPVALMRLARHVADELGRTPLPTPRMFGASLDTAAVIRQLGDLSDELDGYLAEVALEARQAQTTQNNKNRAIATYDTTYTAVIQILNGLLLLAGEPELAERIRPTRRRAQQAEGEEQAPSTPSTPAAAQPTPAPQTPPAATNNAPAPAPTA